MAMKVCVRVPMNKKMLKERAMSYSLQVYVVLHSM